MKTATRTIQAVLLAAAMSAAAAYGFDASLKIEPPLIGLNESAALSIEVRGARNPQPPALPQIPGLRMAYAGQSQQTSWVNGTSDSFTAFNYTVYPQQTGDFTIGPFEYRADGQTRTLQGRLQVAAAGSAQQTQNWSELVFARITADRPRAYVQEPFELMLSVYSRPGVQLAGGISLGNMPQTGLPELEWTEVPGGREMAGNVIYDVRRFRTRTRALSSGRFEFKPTVTVQAVVQSRRDRPRGPFDDSFFDSFFGRTETRPVDVPVEAAALDVLPLPDEGRPDGFSGAVGRFTLEVQAEPRQVAVGDPVTVQILIGGDGNFDRIQPPPLPEDRFRLYGDPVRRQTDQAVLFEQVVSPRSADTSEFPPVEFAYFDTAAGQYRTLRSAPVPLAVSAAQENKAQIFAADDALVLPPEDRPFATESDVQRAVRWLKTQWARIRPWLWTVPAVLLLATAVIAGKNLYRRRDPAKARRRQAEKEARKALHAADRARHSGDAAAFYDALWKALSGFFAGRLLLPPGEAGPDAVRRALEQAGCEEEIRRNVSDVLDRIERFRYGTPDSVPDAGRMQADRTLIHRLLRRFPRLRPANSGRIK